MWFNIIPIAIILISGAVLVYIITKKFPALTNLDLATLPQEREKMVKHRIISTRLKRSWGRWFTITKKFIQPLLSKISEWVKELYHKMLSARENLAADKAVSDITEIEKFFAAAEEEKRKENYEEAEKIYIRIISLDSKNIAAFKMLGQLYAETGKLQEAQETLAHVLKLTKEDAEVYSRLAAVEKENGDLEKAQENYLLSIKLNSASGLNYFSLAEIAEQLGKTTETAQYLKEALKIEPKNPKYIDAMFSISIINKDKAEALDAYKTLKEINPENAKLGEMKKQIDAL